MASFSYFGFEYEINEDDKTVVLHRADSASGKVFIPKEVENGNKKYTVVGIGGFYERFYYWGGGEIETDGRKKNYWRVEPHWIYDHLQIVSPFVLFNGKNKTHDEWIVPNMKITYVVLPDTVKTLGDKAFSECYALEEVSLPKSITEIPFACFWYAKALKHIELHEGITYIHRAAFGGCTALTEITIPSSVKTIDEDAFCDTYHAKSGLSVVNILNDEGAVIIHPNAFTDRVKINYLGKKGAKKAKSETKPAPKPEPKPVQTASEPKEEPKPAAKPVSTNGNLTVGSVVEAFKKQFGAVLRIYNGRSKADGGISLQDVGLKQEISTTFDGKQKVGDFIAQMAKVGLTVKVYTCDDWVAVLDGLTLEQAGMVKKSATKADMESMISKKTDTTASNFKKSAVSGDYTIGITPDNKVVVSKGGTVCDNAKGTMREISEMVGFKFETSWTTQQLGSKLVDFLNSK